MKPVRSVASALCAAVLLSLASGAGAEEKAAVFRRFNAGGKTFYAAITSKAATSVTLKLQNGKTVTQPIRSFSEPDQQFIRKWTKFKDDLLNNAEFASLKVQEILEMRGYQSFEFDIEGNHIYVEGEVAGKPMRFMIDTGADSSLIHDGSAKDAKLEMGPYDVEIRGVGGKAMAAITKVPVIKLGDAVIEGRRLLATDLFKNGGGVKTYDVIFGADFLRELDACISYREGRMFLKPDNIGKAAAPDPKKPDAAAAAAKAEFRRWTKTDGGSFVAALENKSDTEATFRFQNGKSAPLALDKLSEADRETVQKWSKLRDELAKNPEFRTLTVKELLELRSYQSFQYRLDGNHILVDGKVGDTKARFLIDTGAHSCIMDVKFAKDVAKLEVGPMDQKVFGIGGEAPAAITKVPRMQLGDAIITDREALSIDLFKDAVGQTGNHDALFGADFLRELDAVINYKEGRMFLKPDNSDKAVADPGSTEEKKDAPAEEKKKEE